MTSATPVRRLAAGAATALLAAGLLMPAAVAVADEAPLEDQTTTALETPGGELQPTGTIGSHELRVVARDPRLAQTGVEAVIPGILLVAALLAAGATLLATRRLGGR